MAPSTPPPPSRVEFAALTIASTPWRVISPITTRPRPPRNDSMSVSLTAWLSSNFVEHVLTSQCLRDTFGLVFGQWMIRIGARNLENAIVEHHDTERAECNAGTDDDLIHVVNAETAGLFNPIFDEGLAQSVFGFRLVKIRVFDDETIFAHFFLTLSRSNLWIERGVRVHKKHNSHKTQFV